ncbi:MAG: type III-A CRISPR-associated RAMP protein Csm3 [Vulcanisaeta sp.]|nr:type III-A CRISPR-associated RAMP protein Csm3 [Vulcanisaeta sp.]
MSSSSYLMPKIRLVGIAELGFTLMAKSGFLIRSGRTKEVMGAADVEPLSITKAYIINGRPYRIRVPYIPGSSLKGRARSLLETALGLDLHTTDGKIYYHMRVSRGNTIVHDDPYCPVDNVFGSMSVQPQAFQPGEEGASPYSWFIEKCWAPTRAIFRDIFPSQRFIEQLCNAKGGCEGVGFDDFIEEKSENRIDRVTSAADPRTILRVRPDVEFEGSITFLIFDVDVCRRRECDEHSKFRDLIRDYPARYYLASLIDSLILVEETYIGGSGTRGYGNIEFRNISLRFQNLAKGEVGLRKVAETNDLVSIRRAIDGIAVFDELRDAACKSGT